ncbi:MAG: sigma-70 family RNA polymerase sigma factor [Anaerolineae bacterium]|nr:sigma-70 family RNA polymerase sigma factor [Anaerolineae bacterium]
MSTDLDDQTLIRMARRFDESALSAIFDRYYEPLYRYIYHQVRHVETAEDLAGEVFQRLLAKLQTGHGPERYLKAWLFKVATNLVIDESRRLVYRDHLEFDETLYAGGAGVDEQAQQAILIEHAHTALQKLTPKQRSIILLKFVEGLENDEVARIVGLPVGAVKSLQHRALGALRRHLANIMA